jgi:hypothetical protein
MSDKLGKPLSGSVTNVTCKMSSEHQRYYDSNKVLPLENKDSPACLRGDILLSSIPISTKGAREPTNAQSPVFNLDTLSMFEEKEIAELNIHNQPPQKVLVVQNYAQYLLDLYDARTRFELYLATHQLCFVIVENDGDFSVYSPDHRIFKGSAGTNPSFDIDPKIIALRRNIVLCVPVKDQDKYSEVFDNLARANNLLVIKIFYPTGPESTDFTVQSLTDADWVTIKNNMKPAEVKVSAQSDQRHAPRLPVYMGIALTDAFFATAYGDDRVTTNRYSLLSMRNGPLHVVNEDKVHWIFRCEAYNYSPDGCRFARPLWFDASRTRMLPAYQALSNGNFLRIDTKYRRNDKEGSNITKKFTMIPLKSVSMESGFYSTGYLDESNNGRVVGIAKQNGDPGHNIDVINVGRGVI